MANQTIVSNVDEEKLHQLLNETEQNVQCFDNITENIINAETSSLDDLMRSIYTEVLNSEPEIPLDKLEHYYLELTNLLYFMGTKLEKINVRSDLAKAAAKEVYNKAYLNNQIKDGANKNKTTVAENQAVAENASVYENTVQSMYNHAYKVIQYKVDAGYEMVKTMSKLLSRRMQEIDLSNYQKNIRNNFSIDPTKPTLME